MADGSVIHTGTRARKSAAGYDLTRLFVGSEGTLGVITEVTLRLHPVPEAILVAHCTFGSIREAVETVIETIQLGISVARIELLDELQVAASNRYSKTSFPVGPTLLIEFHGETESSVKDQAATVEQLAASRGGRRFEWASTAEERERLWRMRHEVMNASLALRPGSKFFANDTCVPISQLANCIEECKKDMAELPFPSTLLGHVGDGNFHVGFVLDPENPEELRKAMEVEERLIRRALSMGGTCTGEHGVGIARIKYLPIEHGPALDVMKAIKLALDPNNRMNPGKMFDFDGVINGPHAPQNPGRQGSDSKTHSI
jgi:D-lactate dehydrogenase (cytochrome)